jgi:Carboxypeptidase regulatory-like domain
MQFFRLTSSRLFATGDGMQRRIKSNWIYVGFGLVLLLATLSPAKEKKKQPESYALLSGTCFDARGFRLSGASVRAELTSEPTVKLKKKKWEAISSPRGEFAIRLPAGQYTFRVSAAKDGFKPVEKTVSFEADERQDIGLSLEAEPTNK